MTSETKIINQVIFQVWVAAIVIGIIVSGATGSFIPFSIIPWIGLLCGIATDKILTPVGNAKGIEIA